MKNFEIVDRIKLQRETLKISGSMLAERIAMAPSVYSKIESHQERPRPSQLVDLGLTGLRLSEQAFLDMARQCRKDRYFSRRKLFDIRESKGKSATDLSKECGYAIPQVANFESGKAVPTDEVIEKLGEHLGVDPSLLFEPLYMVLEYELEHPKTAKNGNKKDRKSIKKGRPAKPPSSSKSPQEETEEPEFRESSRPLNDSSSKPKVLISVSRKDFDQRLKSLLEVTGIPHQVH